MTQSALVLGSEEFRNEPLHKIRYGVRSSIKAMTNSRNEKACNMQAL